MMLTIAAVLCARALLLTQAQDSCNLEPFLEQTTPGRSPCRTCFFPTSSHINKIRLSDYKHIDYSNQWIYFHGDSTLRQFYGAFQGIVQNMQPLGYAELKHHLRQECPDQLRDPYVPPPYDKTPCYVNEKTCTSLYNDTSLGQSFNVTYDWKHLMYEDYDRWLYNRWRFEETGPTLLFVSPGLHDCYHDPDQFEYHARKLRHLLVHLTALPQTVVYIDMNPFNEEPYGQKRLECAFYVNAVGHALAKELGMLMFSRQTMFVSGEQEDTNGRFPIHQSDENVDTQVKYLLAWLGCIMEHKRAGRLTV